MSTVPYGNMGGVNQTSPAAKSTALSPVGTMSASPQIPGGNVPSSTNPYMFSSPGTTGNVPSQQDPNLQKQWTDIYGKGTGGAMLSEYQGLQGTNNAAFQALVASMAPQFAKEQANFGQSMGAAGVSPNSTVQSLGLADLLAQQGATLSGADAQMIMQNQQERLGLLQGTEQASATETAQSGWDVFGKVAGALGGIAGTMMGNPGGLTSLMSLFKGASNAGLSTPSVTGVNTQPELSGDYSIPSETYTPQTLDLSQVDVNSIPVGGYLPSEPTQQYMFGG